STRARTGRMPRVRRRGRCGSRGGSRVVETSLSTPRRAHVDDHGVLEDPTTDSVAIFRPELVDAEPGRVDRRPLRGVPGEDDIGRRVVVTRLARADVVEGQD